MSAGRAEMMQLVKRLQKAKFQVERTNGGHWKVMSPDGQGPVYLAFSPKSSGQKMTLKKLREIGYTGK